MISLPEPPQGNTPFVQWAQRLTAWLRSNMLVQGADYTLRRSAKGTIMGIRTCGGSSAPAQQKQTLHFAQMFMDYWMSQEGIAVARPPLTRGSIVSQTTLDGLVWHIVYYTVAGTLCYQARKKTTGNYLEFQRISPCYQIGQAVECIQSSTGLTYLDADNVNQPVAWEENNSSRMWTRRLDQSTF